MNREALAQDALIGVGNPSAGEWVEQSRAVFHLRRRLTDDEIGLLPEYFRTLWDIRSLPRVDVLALARPTIESWPHGSKQHRMVARLVANEIDSWEGTS